jgi:Protein of unknown function (DUF3376)
MARYETICEDLQRVLDRNRLIERVGSILADPQIEDDVRNGGYITDVPVVRDDWGEQDLKAMIEREGIVYGGYHRLKVAAVTDEIAEMIARAAGFDVHSDGFFAVRHLVRAWRRQAYTSYLPENGGQPGKATENGFLVGFDLEYRVRRLRFVLDKIDQIHPLGEDVTNILRALKLTDASIQSLSDPETREYAAFRADLKNLRTELNGCSRACVWPRKSCNCAGRVTPSLGPSKRWSKPHTSTTETSAGSSMSPPRDCATGMPRHFWKRTPRCGGRSSSSHPGCVATLASVRSMLPTTVRER